MKPFPKSFAGFRQLVANAIRFAQKKTNTHDDDLEQIIVEARFIDYEGGEIVCELFRGWDDASGELSVSNRHGTDSRTDDERNEITYDIYDGIVHDCIVNLIWDNARKLTEDKQRRVLKAAMSYILDEEYADK